MKTSLNLLPWRCRRTQILRLRLKQWLWPCCLSAGGVAVFLAVQGSRYVAARQRLERLERQHLPVQSIDAQVAALRGRIDGQSRQIEVVRRLEGCRPPLALLGLVARSVRDCQGRLQVESLALHPVAQRATAAADPAAGRAKTAAKAGRPKITANRAKPASKTDAKDAAESDGDSALVSIQGIAMDNLSVARLVAALRQTKAFRHVELKSTQAKPWGAGRACAFLVECGY